MAVTPVLWRQRRENQKFQEHPELYTEVEGSLGCLRPHLKDKQTKTVHLLEAWTGFFSVAMLRRHRISDGGPIRELGRELGY